MKILTKEDIIRIGQNRYKDKDIDYDYIYSCYSEVISPNSDIIKENLNIEINDSYRFVSYLLGEYNYYLDNNPKEKISELKTNLNFKTRLISTALDKFLTNEHLAYNPSSYADRYAPVISSISLYLNFVLGKLYGNEKNNPSKTLLIDLLDKAFLLSKSIINLLLEGFENVAFSTWRTLHETECIVTLVSKYKDAIVKPYLKHMNYSAAFRGLIKDEEEVNKIFVQIKEEMKALDLKSKDMKKFIEYGYISELKEYRDMELKLNFRDGVEKLAGLSLYSKTYEMSSEIAHSSPIMIYSRKEYFYYLTILNIYETFFRLELVFYEEYKKSNNEKEIRAYEILRRNYLSQLGSIYQIELKKFNILRQ